MRMFYRTNILHFVVVVVVVCLLVFLQGRETCLILAFRIRTDRHMYTKQRTTKNIHTQSKWDDDLVYFF